MLGDDPLDTMAGAGAGGLNCWICVSVTCGRVVVSTGGTVGGGAEAIADGVT